jgi:hypothetical protein
MTEIFLIKSDYECFTYSDLGAHIDGFAAVVAHTLVVGASKVIISYVFNIDSHVSFCQHLYFG